MTHSALDGYTIHPAAALFPLLDNDALAELAEDIKARGLKVPVIVDADGTIIDGRNRLLACSLAGIEARFTRYEGDDPVADILSWNIQRRHLTQGARAVLAAKARRLFVANNQAKAAKMAGVSQSRVAYADVVLDHAPDLADQVIAGASLDEAYRKAQEIKAAKGDAEEVARRNLASLEFERQRAIDKLEKAREAIGAPVTVPPEPELAIVFTPGPDGESVDIPDPAPALGDNLDRESAFLHRLNVAKREIEAISQIDPIDDAWFYEGHVMSVRSWASQVLTSVHGMVDRYNATLEQRRDTPLRSVQ